MGNEEWEDGNGGWGGKNKELRVGNWNLISFRMWNIFFQLQLAIPTQAFYF